MATADKLNYLKETKKQIKEAIVNKGGSVDESTTFREYAGAIEALSSGEVLPASEEAEF